MDLFCGATFWDYRKIWYTDNPTFSPCFEKIVLGLAPCIFLWICFPFEWSTLRQRTSRNDKYSIYSKIKLGSIALIEYFIVSDIVLNIFENDTNVPNICWLLGLLITYVLLFGLCIMQITRRKASSGVLFLFSLFTVIFGFPQFLTEISSIRSRATQYTIWEAYLYIVIYAIEIVILVLNCFADSALTNENDSAQERASFVSKSMMIWMYPYVWKNHKYSQIIGDLWSVDYRTTIFYSLPIFQKYWKRNSNKMKKRNTLKIDQTPISKTQKSTKIRKKQSQISITSILLKISRPFLKTMMITNLLAALFLTFNNQIINYIVTFMLKDDIEWHGYYYATLPFLCSIINTIFSIISYKAADDLKLCLDCFLPSIIYRKALDLSMGAQKIHDDSEIIDIIISKTDSITNRTAVLCKLIMSLMIAVICVIYIWQIMGVNTIILIVIFVGLLVTVTNIKKTYAANFLAKSVITRKRMKLIRDVFSGFKVLKLYAWETAFEIEILNHRNAEIQFLEKNQKLDSIVGSLFFSFSTVVLLCPILSMLLLNNQRILTIQEIFNLIGLINSLTTASLNFPYIVQNISVMKFEIGKITEFLNAEETEHAVFSRADDGYALSIENGVFSWYKKENVEILRNINIKVAKKELVAVMGPLGSGKTSLLLGFLGEPHNISGNVNVQGTIAYVPQQAWILNKTVKQNIVMNKSIDEEFYNTVLEACSLTQDIDSFPKGDLTEIGEKGINLSGGQKQRISLARAVYADADVYLLDDIFSALDLLVASHIFHRVVGPRGLLHQKTRVIVTHNTQFLSQMDRIVMLNNQTIVKSDTYQNLKNADPDFINILKKLSDKSETNETLGKIDDMLKDGKYINSQNTQKGKTDEKTGSSSLMNQTNDDFHTEKISTNNFVPIRNSLPTQNGIETAITKLTSTGKSKKTKGFMTVYRENSSREDLFLTLGIAMILILYHIFRISTNLGLAYWSRNEDEIHISNLTYAEIIITLVAISFVMCYVYQAIVCKTFFNISCHAHNKLLSTVMKWPMILYEAIPSSQLINRFGLYITILDDRTSPFLSTLLVKKTQVLFTFLFAIYVNPFYLMIILLSTVCEYAAQKITENRKTLLAEAISKQTAVISAHTLETLNGLTSIRAMNLNHHFTQKFDEKIERRAILQHNFNQYEIWVLIQKRVSWIILTFFGILAVIFRREDPIEITGFVVTYILTMIIDFTTCDKLSAELEKSINALRRITEYTDTPCENITQTNTVRSSWPENGNIVFKHLHVRYRQSGPVILKDLNFEVNSGEKVGVIGRTGAGKTSLISSIFRITEFLSGSIEIDNVDITMIALHDLRSKLTVIPQDPVLFSGTLRLNLDPLKEHSDEKLWSILEQAHLKSFVIELPNKLDHVIETGGGNMSVGQKQLICLGRALLRKTKILILDEATASVDLNTDGLIQSTIQREFKHCTVLTIAHRIQTVFNYDKILVLNDGSITEYDTPENMLRNENSAFRRLATIAQLI